MEGFGQTETTIVVGNFVGMAPKIGSMGKASPLYDVQLITADGKFAEVGEPGEICIRYDRDNPPAGIMMEYYRNPEKTAEAEKPQKPEKKEPKPPKAEKEPKPVKAEKEPKNPSLYLRMRSSITIMISPSISTKRPTMYR